MCVHMSSVCVSVVCVTQTQCGVCKWTLLASCIEPLPQTSPLFSWFGWALTVYTPSSLCTHHKSLGFSNKSTSSLHCVRNAVVCGGLESKRRAGEQIWYRRVGGRIRIWPRILCYLAYLHRFLPTLHQWRDPSHTQGAKPSNRTMAHTQEQQSNRAIEQLRAMAWNNFLNLQPVISPSTHLTIRSWQTVNNASHTRQSERMTKTINAWQTFILTLDKHNRFTGYATKKEIRMRSS